PPDRSSFVSVSERHTRRDRDTVYVPPFLESWRCCGNNHGDIGPGWGRLDHYLPFCSAARLDDTVTDLWPALCWHCLAPITTGCSIRLRYGDTSGSTLAWGRRSSGT